MIDYKKITNWALGLIFPSKLSAQTPLRKYSESEQQLINEINGINWDEYTEPEYYYSQKIIPSLSNLIYLRNEYNNSKTYSEVLFAIGNDHAGTYYPVVLKALPIIIKIVKISEYEVVRNCTINILSDLCYCFQPELGSFNTVTETELERFVKNTIKEFIEQRTIMDSERNEILIEELLEYLQEENRPLSKINLS